MAGGVSIGVSCLEASPVVSRFSGASGDIVLGGVSSTSCWSASPIFVGRFSGAVETAFGHGGVRGIQPWASPFFVGRFWRGNTGVSVCEGGGERRERAKKG